MLIRTRTHGQERSQHVPSPRDAHMKRRRPNMYSLEEHPGATYLRAGPDDGIEIWTWRMPGEARDVER